MKTAIITAIAVLTLYAALCTHHANAAFVDVVEDDSKPVEKRMTCTVMSNGTLACQIIYSDGSVTVWIPKITTIESHRL